MQFSILKDPKKIEAVKSKFTESYKEKSKRLGRVVSHSMPAYENPFSELSSAINQSGRFMELRDRYCVIEGKHRTFMEFIPALNYYSTAFYNAHSKILGLNWTITELSKTMSEVDLIFRNSRQVRPETGQSFFQLNEQVYQIQNNVAGFLMYTRSILDTLATSMYVFYEGQQYNSFSDYIKSVRKEPSFDPEMAKYISNNFSWFEELRDFRDYWTHIGTVQISFYEDESGHLVIVTNGQLNLFQLLRRIQLGMDEFIGFFCNHFINRIQNY